MKKMLRTLTFCLVLFMFLPLRAGERTIPVDMILMIDKSLSMADPGKFDSMHAWVRDQLVGQMLIDGDWVAIYQFYGKTDRLMAKTLSGAADRQKLIATIDSIQPDGKYTDIGLALDTIQTALDDRGTNGRHKIMLLLTDLKQEAPWTSRYAGTPDNFESPYLAEARMLKHDSWYEITLDMDIQDEVVRTSRELYASIQDTPRTDAGSGEKTGGRAVSPEQGSPEGPITGIFPDLAGFGLPLLLCGCLVVLFAVILVCTLLVRAFRARRAKKDTRAE